MMERFTDFQDFPRWKINEGKDEIWLNWLKLSLDISSPLPDLIHQPATSRETKFWNSQNIVSWFNFRDIRCYQRSNQGTNLGHVQCSFNHLNMENGIDFKVLGFGYQLTNCPFFICTKREHNIDAYHSDLIDHLVGFEEQIYKFQFSAK